MQAAAAEAVHCPCCSAPNCIPEHLWWECLAFAGVCGSGPVVEAVRSGGAPLCLARFGVPPALRATG
eukprot:5393371-Alexandrium_andersonii.AAC.1